MERRCKLFLVLVRCSSLDSCPNVLCSLAERSVIFRSADRFVAGRRRRFACAR